MKYRIITYQKTLIKESLEKLLQAHNIDEAINFVIGGDGALLKAIGEYGFDNPYLLINGGHLGYFSECTEENLEKMIEDLINHQLQPKPFVILESIIDHKPYYAFNDITLSLFNHAFKANIVIDHQKLETFCGTGLVISTPQGSSGYNKSLNGPIVSWQMPSMQITGIAGIINSCYQSLVNPLVISNNSIVTIENYKNQPWQVAFDNQVINHGIDTLTITKSQKIIKLYLNNDTNQISRLIKHLAVHHD